MISNRRRKEIEQLAEEFRRKEGIFSCGISNIFDLCNNKYYLIRYPLGSNAVLGAVIYKDNDYIVFSNSSSVLSREIFTVAHEIGHIYLGHITLENQLIQDITLENINDQETEANHFAACLLMPQDEVNKFIATQLQNKKRISTLEVAAIMSAFNVSFEMVVNRLTHLNIISSTEHDDLLNKKSDTTVSNLLRAIGVSPTLCIAQKIKSVPVEFLQWLLFNYQHGLIPVETLQKAIEFLDEIAIEDFGVCSPKDDEDFDLDAYLGNMD